MEALSDENLRVQTDISAAIEIIRHAGAWMRDNENEIGNYSKWWDPDQVDADMLSPYAQPDDFYVVSVGNQPAATAILQEKQTFQDWSSVDKDNDPPKAIYLAYIAVERDLAGHGLVKALVDQAALMAKECDASVLRLDTNANEPKLCGLYESLGFHQVGTEQIGDYTTAFYEKPVTIKPEES